MAPFFRLLRSAAGNPSRLEEYKYYKMAELHEEEILDIMEALYGAAKVPPLWSLRVLFADAATVSIEWADHLGTHRAKLIRPQLPNEPWLPISR